MFSYFSYYFPSSLFNDYSKEYYCCSVAQLCLTLVGQIIVQNHSSIPILGVSFCTLSLADKQGLCQISYMTLNSEKI